MAAQRWWNQRPLASPWLHEEVARRMAERLEWFREPPTSWLHWEPAHGGLAAHAALRERLPAAACFVHAEQLDWAVGLTREPAAASWNPLRWSLGMRPQPAQRDTQVDMVWANMALHLEPRPQTLLKRWHGHVAHGGFLMFTCLGPDTLRDLRALFTQHGWPEPAHPFTDMHDWGDMLVQGGFAEPVMDMERIQLSFSTADAVLQELREMGRNLNARRFGALRGKAWRAALGQAIEQQLPRSDEGRLLLNFEVIYGHAFKASPRVKLLPESAVSVDEMREMLRQRPKPA